MVSVLVVPAVITTVQTIQLRTAFKEVYSILDQATRSIARDNSGTIKGLCINGDHPCVKNLYKERLNYIKECNNAEGNNNCWHQRNEMYTMYGTNMNAWSHNDEGINAY